MQKLSVADLLYGYNHGFFPMSDENTNDIYWYSPDPRAIIPIETYKCHKSLKSVINKKKFEIKLNTSFEEVIRSCSMPRFEGDSVWISEDIIKVYLELHHFGFAHSVEAWQDEQLVGGLYGVALGSVFFGESMFYKVSDASKVAFHYLIQILRNNNFLLLDTQFINDNVKRFGAIEIKKSEFLKLLNKALNCPNTFKFQ
jgi:leucyl/phenylalanyl-tRNA--protein transferase